MSIWDWFRGLRQRHKKLDEDLDAEIESHLRMAARDRIDRGEDSREAMFSVRREFGNVSLVKEVTREMRRMASLERFAKETRYAVRGLSKSPAFSIAAALTLAVGLAAATIIFGVVNTVLLRPLPFADSDRILTVSESIPALGPRPQVVTLEEYMRWRDSGVFDKCAALDTAEFTLLGAGRPERIAGVQVTAEFFRIFGVRPALGRDFRRGEDAPGAGDVVILSHQLWAGKFHSDPNIVGKTVRFADSIRTVIGVMPIGFDFPRHADLAGLMSWLPEETEFWIPFQFTQKDVEHGNFNFLVLGRLRPGLALQQAQPRLQALTHQFWVEGLKRHPEFAALILQNLPMIRVHPDPLQTTMTSGIRSGLWILFGAVGLLLILIYANLANLFLTRNAARLRDVAIRQALGASGWQILYERFMESAVFGAIGAGLGLLLTIWGMAAIRTFGAGHLPRLYELRLDYRVVLFLSFLAFTASLLFGIVPWMLQRRLQFGLPLQEHNRTTAGGRAERRVRAWLVTAEIAFSMVLLVNAALLLASFRQVLHADPGFDTNNLLTVNIGLPWQKFQKQEQRYRHFERLLDSVRKIPGVEFASMTNAVPFRGEAELRSLRLAGQRQEAVPHAELRMVDPDYLRTMHIPLIRGRWFQKDERQHVTVISGNMARRYWPRGDPLGQQFFENENKLTIIGVVGAVRNATLEREPTLQFYIPAAANVYAGMWFVIRTRVPPENVISGVRRSVTQVDPEQPLAHIRTMREILDATTLSRRFETWLFASFAGTALFLSVLGVFGVLSLSVTRRTREFGIRMALGATAGSVLRLVLREASRLLAAGVVVGVVLAVLSGRLLRSLLYGVSATDPRVYVVTTVVLVAAAFFACWVPARRAAGADPAAVLRDE